jgi:hypothetical protein
LADWGKRFGQLVDATFVREITHSPETVSQLAATAMHVVLEAKARSLNRDK